jgi:hypothetical protein
MNVQAPELKAALRKLAPVKTETYQIGDGTISAQDQAEGTVVQKSPLTGLSPAFNLSGKKLASVVSRMSGQIEVTRGDKSLTLKSAKARIELEIQTAKPIAVPVDPERWLQLPAADFKRNLALAASAASPAKSAAFGGVVLLQSLPVGLEQAFPAGYRAVGTDSIVLTVANQPLDLPFEFSYLLNLTAAGIVQLMDTDVIEVGETNTALHVRGGGTAIYATKPVQKYPEFSSFLALPALTKLRLEPAELLAALRTVEPLMDEAVDQGQISLQFSDGVVYCRSIGDSGSRAQDEAPYEQLEPDPVFEPKEHNLKLLAKYLIGFLSKAQGVTTLSITERPVRLEADGMVVLAMSGKGSK